MSQVDTKTIDITYVLESMRAQVQSDRERTDKLRRAIPKVRAFLKCIAALDHFGDIGAVHVGATYYSSSEAEVDLHLRDGVKDSPIVREMVRATGVSARKTPLYDKSGFTVFLSLRGLRISLHGYKPQTCRLVEYEEDVPATPAHKVKKFRMVCVPESEEQPSMIEADPGTRTELDRDLDTADNSV